MSANVCCELTCDELVPQGESKTLILLTLQKLEISTGFMVHLAHIGFSSFLYDFDLLALAYSAIQLMIWPFYLNSFVHVAFRFPWRKLSEKGRIKPGFKFTPKAPLKLSPLSIPPFLQNTALPHNFSNSSPKT